MTPDEIKEHLADMDEEILFADGFDDALIGYVERFGSPTIAVYDRAKCIRILMDEMSEEESEEYFEFNVVGAYVESIRRSLLLCWTTSDIQYVQ